MMIEAVIVRVSPEMLEALKKVAESDQQIENWLHVNGESIERGTPALISSYGAELMVESWFDPEDLDFFREKNSVLDVEFPKFCDDPLIKEFVQTVLKIYRLTVSV